MELQPDTSLPDTVASRVVWWLVHVASPQGCSGLPTALLRFGAPSRPTRPLHALRGSRSPAPHEESPCPTRSSASKLNPSGTATPRRLSAPLCGGWPLSTSGGVSAAKAPPPHVRLCSEMGSGVAPPTSPRGPSRGPPSCGQRTLGLATTGCSTSGTCSQAPSSGWRSARSAPSAKSSRQPPGAGSWAGGPGRLCASLRCRWRASGFPSVAAVSPFPTIQCFFKWCFQHIAPPFKPVRGRRVLCLRNVTV